MLTSKDVIMVLIFNLKPSCIFMGENVLANDVEGIIGMVVFTILVIDDIYISMGTNVIVHI